MARTIQQLFDLKGQTALVTGGSRGLGLQMAHALGEAGAKVIVSSRKAEDLMQAVAELKAAGIDADWIAADCGKETDIRALLKSASSAWGISTSWSTTLALLGVRQLKTTLSKRGTKS
jgi:gluconate 5-dehydrogenase